MVKVLVPIDGSAPSLRAVDRVLKQIDDGREVEVHLLNVQLQAITGHARAYLSKEMVDEYYHEEAEKALAPARQKLDAAGVKYKESRAIGNPADSIANYVRNNGIELIVMGTRGLGSVQGMLLGSVANKVLYLVDVPVTLVK